MAHTFFPPVVLSIVLVAVGGGAAGCRAVPAPPEQLTDAERATIGDTVRHLYRESSQTFDSDLDCEEIVERLALGGRQDPSWPRGGCSS